jgi:hypothetical protein
MNIEPIPDFVSTMQGKSLLTLISLAIVLLLLTWLAENWPEKPFR